MTLRDTKNGSGPDNHSPVTILVVEDDDAHVELIRRGFSGCNDTVNLLVAMSVGAARAEIMKAPPDLVLADWLLPDGKGAELITSTHGLPEIPVVIMTSHGSEQIAVDVMKSGAIDYVVKSETTFAEMPHISTRALRQWKTMRDHALAEQALHDNQQELELALQAARAGVWYYDIQNGIIRWSKEYALLLGHGSETSCPDYACWVSCIHPDDRDLIHRTIPKKTGPCERDIDLEYRIVLPDGNIRWMNDRGRVFFDPTGKPIRVLGISVDITSRKMMELALQQEQEQYKNLVANINDVIFSTDPHGVLTYVSPVSERVFGVPPSEAIGRHFSDFIHPEVREEVREQFSESLHEMLQGFETRVMLKSGKVQHIRISGRVVSNNGEVTGVTGMITDLTERKQLEELKVRAFQQIEKNLEQLAALNDQIRNPLSVIVLLAGAAGGPEGKKIIEQAMEIDALVKKLDQGWAESAKVRTFLKKHYQITKE
ncbi:MAG: PAS domain S-box protein [Methanomicrobiales archaeon]